MRALFVHQQNLCRVGESMEMIEVNAVLANPSLVPVLYQAALPQADGDRELDQQLAFLHSFRQKK
jgi:hypothetical protein